MNIHLINSVNRSTSQRTANTTRVVLGPQCKWERFTIIAMWLAAGSFPGPCEMLGGGYCILETSYLSTSSSESSINVWALKQHSWLSSCITGSHSYYIQEIEVQWSNQTVQSAQTLMKFQNPHCIGTSAITESLIIDLQCNEAHLYHMLYYLEMYPFDIDAGTHLCLTQNWLCDYDLDVKVVKIPRCSSPNADHIHLFNHMALAVLLLAHIFLFCVKIRGMIQNNVDIGC